MLHPFHISPFPPLRPRTFAPVSALGYMHIPARPVYRHQLLQHQAHQAQPATVALSLSSSANGETLEFERQLPAVTAFLCLYNAKHAHATPGVLFSDFAPTFNATLGRLTQTALGPPVAKSTGSGAGSGAGADTRADVPFIFREDARAVVNLLQRSEVRDEDLSNLRLLPPLSFLSRKLVQSGVYGDAENPRVYETAVPSYSRLADYIEIGLQDISRQTGVSCVLQAQLPTSVLWQRADMKNMRLVHLFINPELETVEQCDTAAALAIRRLRDLFMKLYDRLLDESAAAHVQGTQYKWPSARMFVKGLESACPVTMSLSSVI